MATVKWHSAYDDVQLPTDDGVQTPIDPTGPELMSTHLSRSTRFIKLGFTDDGTINCSIHVARLTDVAKFYALSYTWGPASPTKEILVNGRAFSVRENLWRALDLILRDSKSEPVPYVWVDAISINQMNVLERNQQVQLMPQIYGEAELVLVWISGYGPYVYAAAEEMTAYRPMRPDQENLDHLTPATTGALRALFSEAYWTRMWIVQEFVLAKDMRFYYGDKQFSWTDLRNTMAYLDLSDVAIHCQTHELAAVRDNYQYIRDSSAFRVFRFRKLKKELGAFDIFELILAFHMQDCSDPRDKVFALLGVSSDNKGIQADYTSSEDELFERVLKLYAGKTPRKQFAGLLARSFNPRKKKTLFGEVKAFFGV